MTSLSNPAYLSIFSQTSRSSSAGSAGCCQPHSHMSTRRCSKKYFANRNGVQSSLCSRHNLWSDPRLQFQVSLLRHWISSQEQLMYAPPKRSMERSCDFGNCTADHVVEGPHLCLFTGRTKFKKVSSTISCSKIYHLCIQQC